MLVNLSFQMQLRTLQVGGEAERWFELGDAQHQFVGTVLQVYGGDEPTAVIRTESLRFFIEGEHVGGLREGMVVHGEGTLVIDYYGWVEFLHARKDPPNIFYNLRVNRIRAVEVPDRFVARGNDVVSWPATVSPVEFGSIVELETMEGQPFTREFYIIDFETIDQAVPKTFIGA